jgi:hypothetical protein
MGIYPAADSIPPFQYHNFRQFLISEKSIGELYKQILKLSCARKSSSSSTNDNNPFPPFHRLVFLSFAWWIRSWPTQWSWRQNTTKIDESMPNQKFMTFRRQFKMAILLRYSESFLTTDCDGRIQHP